MFFLHCGIALYNFNQRKKKEKHPLRTVTFSKVSVFKSKTPPWRFSKFFRLLKWNQIAQNITYDKLKNIVYSFEAQNLLKILSCCHVIKFQQFRPKYFLKTP